MAYLLFLILCGIWSASFILMKKASAVFGPVSIAGWRTLTGAAVLAALWWAWAGRGRPWPVRRAELLRLAVPAGVGFVVPYALQPYLIARFGESAFFGMMVSLVPLLTVAASVPVLRIWPQPRQLLGVVLGLACMFVLFGTGRSRGIPWYDFVLGTAVPLAYAVSNTFIKRWFAEKPAVPLTCTSLGMAAGVLLPLGLATEQVNTPTASTAAWAVGALALLGLVGTGAAMAMFYYLIQSRGPLFAGMVTYLVPLGALGWGWLDHERVTAAQLLALLGILASVTLVQWPSGKRPAVRDAAGRAEA